jgi:hypothetical protein
MSAAHSVHAHVVVVAVTDVPVRCKMRVYILPKSIYAGFRLFTCFTFDIAP